MEGTTTSSCSPCSSITAGNNSTNNKVKVSLRLLKDLPLEVLTKIIPFLKRNDILSFYDAIIIRRTSSFFDEDVAHHEKQIVDNVLFNSIHNRLECLCRSWEESVQQQEENTAASTTNIINEENWKLNQMRPTVNRAVAFIRRQIAQQQAQAQAQEQTEEGESRLSLLLRRRQRQLLEEILIMTDLFTSTTKTTTTTTTTTTLLPPSIKVVEWNLFCGRIQVLVWAPRGSHHGMQRILLQANVQLLSPNFDPIHYKAWDDVATATATDVAGQNDNNNDNDTSCLVQLVAESYNFVPTTPMGRLVGISSTDQETLQLLSRYLSDQDTVAVLPPGTTRQQRQSNTRRMIQAIRVVSRSQAKQRLRNHMPNPRFPPYRFYLDDTNTTTSNNDGNDDDLICCWELLDLFQDDGINYDSVQTLMPYWQNILYNQEAASKHE